MSDLKPFYEIFLSPFQYLNSLLGPNFVFFFIVSLLAISALLRAIERPFRPLRRRIWVLAYRWIRSFSLTRIMDVCMVCMNASAFIVVLYTIYLSTAASRKEYSNLADVLVHTALLVLCFWSIEVWYRLWILRRERGERIIYRRNSKRFWHFLKRNIVACIILAVTVTAITFSELQLRG